MQSVDKLTVDAPTVAYQETCKVRSQHQGRLFESAPWLNVIDGYLRGAEGPHPPQLAVQPSSQAPLLGPGPLRTVHASFPAHSSSPANASFRETRLRYGKVLTVNPVVALRMK